MFLLQMVWLSVRIPKIFKNNGQKIYENTEKVKINAKWQIFKVGHKGKYLVFKLNIFMVSNDQLCF